MTRNLKHFLAAGFCMVFAFSLCASAAAQTDSGRRSLRLFGARVVDLAANPPASVTYAACEGPYGIFYSSDFGTTWQLGLGGDNTGGTGRAVAANGEKAFAVLGNNVYSAPHSAPTNWTRLNIEGVNSAQSLALTGSHLIIGEGIAKVDVVDINSQTLISSRELPAPGQITRVAVAPTSGYVYAEQNVGPLQKKIFPGRLRRLDRCAWRMDGNHGRNRRLQRQVCGACS